MLAININDVPFTLLRFILFITYNEQHEKKEELFINFPYYIKVHIVVIIIRNSLLVK